MYLENGRFDYLTLRETMESSKICTDLTIVSNARTDFQTQLKIGTTQFPICIIVLSVSLHLELSALYHEEVELIRERPGIVVISAHVTGL